MPHVIVKPWPGKLAAEMTRLAMPSPRDVAGILCYGSASVAFEDVETGAWREHVYEPDVIGNADTQ